MSSTSATIAVERAPRVPGPIVATLHFLALSGAAAVIAETTQLDHWKLGALTTIALFSVVSEWTGVRASARIMPNTTAKPRLYAHEGAYNWTT